MWRDEPESTGSATLAMAYLTLFQGTAASQVTYTEEGGALRDGTRYLMRVPSNWNGTLLRDLDYLTNVNNARYLDMLVRGLRGVRHRTSLTPLGWLLRSRTEDCASRYGLGSFRGALPQARSHPKANLVPFCPLEYQTTVTRPVVRKCRGW